MKRNERNVTISAPSSINNTSDNGNVVRLVIDSLTHLLMVSRERTLIQFVIDLAYLLKNFNATAILTPASSSLDHQSLVSSLGSVVDGLIETRIKEDVNAIVIRSTRVRHIKGAYCAPKWVAAFRISANCNMLFSNERSLGNTAQLTCTLCAKPIIVTPLFRSDFVFDSKECMEIYQRLEKAYGSKISDTELPSEAFDASFFFIDMIGLSDPTLSVKNQVHKIEMLNELISSCDGYRKVSAVKTILSAGYGMAVRFLSNQKFHLSLVFSFIISFVHITKGNLLHKKLDSE